MRGIEGLTGKALREAEVWRPYRKWGKIGEEAGETVGFVSDYSVGCMQLNSQVVRE
jgi:hypothetical protein